MKALIGAIAVLLAIGAAVAGCGSSSNSDPDSEAAEHQAAPSQAVTEIAAVRSGLAGALATYKSGDGAAADEQVGTAYLEHFEFVEGPLEKVDHELKEEARARHPRAPARGDQRRRLGRQSEQTRRAARRAARGGEDGAAAVTSAAGARERRPSRALC